MNRQAVLARSEVDATFARLQLEVLVKMTKSRLQSVGADDLAAMERIQQEVCQNTLCSFLISRRRPGLSQQPRRCPAGAAGAALED